MKVNFFKHHFMIIGDHRYYTDPNCLALTYYDWDNSLEIMQVPITCVFVGTYMTGDFHQ